MVDNKNYMRVRLNIARLCPCSQASRCSSHITHRFLIPSSSCKHVVCAWGPWPRTHTISDRLRRYTMEFSTYFWYRSLNLAFIILCITCAYATKNAFNHLFTIPMEGIGTPQILPGLFLVWATVLLTKKYGLMSTRYSFFLIDLVVHVIVYFEELLKIN